MTAPNISSDLLGAIGGVPRPDVDVVVDARDVNKWFGRLHVLKDVSIQVKRQETVVIIGPSGSGKTTFIRCINHLEKIQSGRIFVNGHLIGYREAGGGTKLVEDREAARKARDFASADRIRDELAAAGIHVEDTPTGSHWSLES